MSVRGDKTDIQTWLCRQLVTGSVRNSCDVYRLSANVGFSPREGEGLCGQGVKNVYWHECSVGGLKHNKSFLILMWLQHCFWETSFCPIVHSSLVLVIIVYLRWQVKGGQGSCREGARKALSEGAPTPWWGGGWWSLLPPGQCAWLAQIPALDFLIPQLYLRPIFYTLKWSHCPYKT